MNDYTLAEVFNTVYSQEFSEFDRPLNHFFSRRHRKAMKEILYPQTTSTFAANCKIPLKKRVIILLIVILLLTLGITAGATISIGFTREEHRDNTELFAVNAQEAPKTIEYVYYLPIIPEGYVLHEQYADSLCVITSYIDPHTNRIIEFNQYIKEGFTIRYDNERHILEEVEVNGKYALYHGIDKAGSIIWDNEDYILEIFGDFTKAELVKLAESAEKTY